MKPMIRARLLAHWALQVPAAVASALVPGKDDDSHSNFDWSEAHRAFLSRPLSVVPELSQVQIGLRPCDLTVLLVDPGATTAELSLVGRTLPDSLAAVRLGLEPIVAGELPTTPFRDYDMPPNPLGDAPLAIEDSAVMESVAVLFATLTRVFRAVEGRLEESLGNRRDRELSAARIWPHHFDLGGLITFGASADERAKGDRSVGYGLSSGDVTFTLPYLYVNPYPTPEKAPEVSVSFAAWSSVGFDGFVLHSRELAQKSDEELVDGLATLLLELTN